MLSAKKKIVGIIASFSAIVIIATACTSRTKANDSTSETPATTVSIEKGRQLVAAGGCNDCHTPKIFTPHGPQLDSSRLLSGHPANAPLPVIDTAALRPGNWVHFSPDLTAAVGPWGMTYAANLTSDSATGIGAWGEDNFVKALRTGKHMGLEGGRPIMPPMPWENLKSLSDDDLKSIYAYLKTTTPVNNRVHEPFTPKEVIEMRKEQLKK